MKTSQVSRLVISGLFFCLLSAHAQQKPSTVNSRVNSLLKQFTLDDKLSYIGGTGFFDVKPIPVPTNSLVIQRSTKPTAHWGFAATNRASVSLPD